MTLDPRHLVQLSAIIESGSLGRAAHSLGLTQPALSRNIKTLEAQAGASVLLRDRTGARPTQLGRMLAQYGDAIRQANQNADQAAATVGTFREHEIRIATTPLLATNILCHELPKFIEKEKDVSCRVLTGEPRHIVKCLESGEADIGLCAIGPLPNDSNLHLDKFVDDNLTIFARPDHALLRRNDELTFVDLADYQWIVQRQPAPMRTHVETVMRRAGIDRIDIACETDATSVTVEMVANSNFLAMLPHFPIYPRVAAGDIVPVPIAVEGTKRNLSFVYRKTSQKSPILKAFLQHMRDCIDSWRPSG